MTREERRAHPGRSAADKIAAEAARKEGKGSMIIPTNANRLFALYVMHLTAILQSRAAEQRQLHEGNTDFADCDQRALQRALASLGTFESHV